MNHHIFKKLPIALVLCASAANAPADTLPHLSENEYINDRLIETAVGDAIRTNCPTIKARILYVIIQTKKLRDYTLDLGYTKGDISAYLENPEAQARVRDITTAYLAENGVIEGVSESYCALGQQEIANETLVGSLIKGN